MTKQFDVIVVGGGPGGYVAAIRAAQLGLSVMLVEEKHLGGICLNWGCIPTKALLQGAEVAHSLKTMGTFGFTTSDIEFDINKLVKHSRSVSSRLSKGIGFLMKKNNITVVDGRAKLVAKQALEITTASAAEIYKAPHIILATGARPRIFPGLEVDGKLIWSYFEAMAPDKLPESLLVIGSGAIGVEFASLYNDLGTDVTIVEVMGQIMPVEDREIAEFAEKAFAKRKINVKKKTKVVCLSKGTDSVTCQLLNVQGEEETIVVDRVIVATGVRGNIEDLGLEMLKVTTNNSFIETDEWCRTNLVGLYAIGDVAGPPCLAHKASHEAVICVDKLAGVDGVHPLDASRVPGATYCRPQVASIGMTEQAALDSGYQINVGRFNLQSNGKALAISNNQGLVKTIFDRKSGELLGAHMIGPEVTEQIQGFSIAKALEASDEELISTIFAHPTLSEAMHEAILDAAGKAIHQ